MYYVYCYKDPYTLFPFYVGKGKWQNQRHLDHLKETVENTSNRWKYYKLRSIIESGMLPIIEVIQNNLSEDDAYKLESKLIQKYGKLCDGTGCLTNLLDNQQPPSQKGKSKSEAHRSALSMSHKGKKLSDSTKKKIIDSKKANGTLVSGMKGKKHSEATKLKISNTKSGVKQSADFIERRTAVLKGRKQPTVCCPYCSKIGSISCMKRWHFKNCKEYHGE